MSKPRLENMRFASRLRAPGQRSREMGLTKVGWYRGEQTAHFECCELLRKWGYVRIAKRMRLHFCLNKEGDITSRPE